MSVFKTTVRTFRLHHSLESILNATHFVTATQIVTGILYHTLFETLRNSMALLFFC